MIQIIAWIRSLLVSRKDVTSMSRNDFIAGLHLPKTRSFGAIAVTVVSVMQIMNATISAVVGFQVNFFGSRATMQPIASATAVISAHGSSLAGPHSSLCGLINEIHDQIS